MDVNASTLLDWVRKYNRPGPRYTSYPTALQFVESVDFEALRQDAARAREPVSLYIHLPFCEHRCLFCGCTNVITRQRAKADRYLDFIEREIDVFLAARAAPLPPVVQLHLGGGSPNFLTVAQIERLDALLKSKFTFAADAEKGVELDPRRLSVEQVMAFGRMGMTRASIGIQDCEPAVQKAIGRVQPAELNARAIQWLRAEGFDCINIDLMYGLPLQTAETWARTLHAVDALGPDRVAVFNYAHVPWMKPQQKRLEKYPMPTPDEKLSMLVASIGHFTAGGFEYVGMDHFAKPGDPLFKARAEGTLQRNFQGYSTHAGSQILALGVSSISQTPRAYRQNYKEFGPYEGALKEGRLPLQRGYVLTPDDVARGKAISALMCSLRLPRAVVDAFPGVRAAMEPFEKDGLVVWENDTLRVTEMGRLFVRNIAMAFDAYLKTDEQRFSKTV